MAVPDVVVEVVDAGQPRTLPSDTGQAFMVGKAERGSVVAPVAVNSLDGFVQKFGARQADSALYDAVETFFAEGGTVAYISRVFGAGAVTATRTLLDAGAAVSLTVNANSPGTWGNSLTVAVVAGAAAGEFVIIVKRSGVEVERSYSLVDTAAAIAWAAGYSNYIVLVQGASTNDPAVVGDSALSTGTEGAALADADWQAALDRISSDLGPGQILAPGRTTSAGHLQLVAHAQSRNRFALLDAADTATVSTLVAAAQAIYAAPTKGRRYAQLLAPWDVGPGLTAQTTRTIPPSARLAGQYARVDALGNPNIAAAGPQGTARWILDLSQAAWVEADRKTLNEAGVTVSRRRHPNIVQTYGMRTLADQIQDVNWTFAPNVRVVMFYVARAKNVGEQYQFSQVDGQGHTLSAFRSGLMAEANQLFEVGALYGADPSEAFYVDTGPGINPPALLALGEMHASVKLRTSPSAERVIIQVVRVPITSPVA